MPYREITVDGNVARKSNFLGPNLDLLFGVKELVFYFFCTIRYKYELLRLLL